MKYVILETNQWSLMKIQYCKKSQRHIRHKVELQIVQQIFVQKRLNFQTTLTGLMKTPQI